MEESDVQEFRARFRFDLLERLVLKTAFSVPLLTGALSIAESRDSLTEWLDINSANADQAFGQHFADPAMAALYADEVKEVVEEMKAKVVALAGEIMARGHE